MYQFKLLSIACLSIIPAVPLSGQVSIDMESVFADSNITAVTLYRGRAAITREANIDLQVGGYSVYFSDLPASTSLSSVQATIIGSASLLGVDTIEIPVAKNNIAILEELNSEIEEMETIIDGLYAQEDAINIQKSLLQTMIEQAQNTENPEINLEAMDAQLQYVGRVMARLSSELKTNEKELDQAKKELTALLNRRNGIARDNRLQRNAVVDIGVKQAGKVTVELSYLVSHANWTPSYSIRSNAEGNSINIDYDAEISQSTGENWTDVSITLSTAKPQRFAKPPIPSPWYVEVREPVDIADKEIQTTAMQSRDAYATEFRRGPGAAPAGDMMALGLVGGYADVNEASKAAAVIGDGPVVNFLLPRTLVVPSNSKETQTTSIATIEVESELFRLAVPMMTEDVFIRSEVTNNSPYILLPGMASIFHGSDYVGKSSLATVTPNETFPIDLGIDPSIIATRTLQEKTTSSTGLFASGKQTIFDYRIEISNGHDEPVEIRVWDRMPISQDEEIDISIKNESQPLSTNATYLETQRPLGLLRWDLNAPANSTGESKDSLTWRVEVSRGKDVEITPLPE